MVAVSHGALSRGGPIPGELFAGRYRVERLLGSGGMGYVFAATLEATGERVAIKRLLSDVVDDREVVERFLREGRASARIKDPHGVQIFEASTLPDGSPFIVMECLQGVDLQMHLDAHGRVAHPQAVDWVLEACEAIAEAHSLKIVHRDLKPSNLFLTDTAAGRMVKVLDFGISKSIAVDSTSLVMTRTSSVLGTPYYMSPEQLKSSKDVDERADIWSLGVILFELITGKPPFEAPTLPELSVLVLTRNAPPLVAHGVPAGLARVVATCLEPDRAKRFTSLADFADAIAVFGTANGRASSARIIQRLGLPTNRAWRQQSGDFGVTMPLVGRPSSPEVIRSLPADFQPLVRTHRDGTQNVSRKGMALVLSGCAFAFIVGTVLIVTTLSRGRAASNAPLSPREEPSYSEAQPVPRAEPSSAASASAPPLATPPPTVAPPVTGTPPPNRPPTGVVPKTSPRPTTTAKRPNAFDSEN